MRRALIVMSLVLVFVLGVSAISAQDGIESVDPSGQTVVYWHQYQNESAQGNTMAAIVEQFNSTNEWGITVDASYQGSYTPLEELINAGIVSGELPNLVAGYANAAASFARDDSAVDLLPYLNSPTWGFGENPDLNQALLDANMVDGALLAFPNQTSGYVMAYNQTLLDYLGYDAPPTTIDEYVEIACAAANATGPNGEDLLGVALLAEASHLETWIANNGGTIFHDGAFDFTGDAAMATLQMYHDLYANGCGYFPAERFGEQTDFNNGLIPFYITSSAGFTFVIDGFETSGVEADWGITTFPHTDDNATMTVFVPSIIMMPSTPEAQLASWLFLKYLATPEVAVQWSEGSGYFNPVPSTVETLASSTNFAEGLAPYFNAANEMLNDPDLKKYSNPPLAAYSVVRGLEGTAIADVTSNGMDPADVAATLQEAADQAVADSM